MDKKFQYITPKGKDIRFKNRNEYTKNKHVADLVSLQRFFKRRFGIGLFMTMGTLLGAVREGDFIENDKDIDLLYISKFSDYDSIVKEMVGIYQVFYDMDSYHSFGASLDYRNNCGHGHIYFPNRNSTQFDIWTGWIDKEGYLNFWRIGKKLDVKTVFPLTQVSLRGKKINAPHKYKIFLKYLYGSDWMIPADRKGRHLHPDFFPPLYDLCKNRVIPVNRWRK